MDAIQYNKLDNEEIYGKEYDLQIFFKVLHIITETPNLPPNFPALFPPNLFQGSELRF
jgi:hypothetical protein